MKNARDEVLDALEVCIRRGSLPDETLRALERLDNLPEELSQAVHSVHHFVDDNDLREADPEYRRFWVERLKEIRSNLHSMV